MTKKTFLIRKSDLYLIVVLSKEEKPFQPATNLINDDKFDIMPTIEVHGWVESIAMTIEIFCTLLVKVFYILFLLPSVQQTVFIVK